MMKGILQVSVLVLSSLGLAACGGGSDTAAIATGNATFALTDAPVDGVTAVNVTVTGLELKPASGSVQTITFDRPKHLNLLDLRDGKTANLILQRPLPAGDYNWVRLMLDTSQQSVQVNATGGTQSLTIPSGAETGLKLVRGFTVPSGGNINFVLDFNLRKSLVLANGAYFLKPTLRIVDESTAGEITGTVDVATLEQQLGCTNLPAGYNGVVYLYAGSNATVGDYGSSNEPYLASAVTYGATSNYRYTLAHLPPANYTLAYTCSVDDTSTAEALKYSSATNVTVQANQTATVNLPGVP